MLICSMLISNKVRQCAGRQAVQYVCPQSSNNVLRVRRQAIKHVLLPDVLKVKALIYETV